MHPSCASRSTVRANTVIIHITLHMYAQVDALRERIEELSEDLELARSAAAAAAAAAAGMQAAAAAAAAAAASSGGSASTQGGASGSAAAATSAGGTCGEQQQLAALKVAVVIHDGEGEDGGVHAEPQSPGRELSQREVVAGRTVPLMGEDTPLEALHAQVRSRRGVCLWWC